MSSEDSKSIHEFTNRYLENYEFGIFTGGDTTLRTNTSPMGVVKAVTLPSEFLTLDMVDPGDGIKIPFSPSSYTRLTVFPEGLRDLNRASTSTSDDYTGGPGFTYVHAYHRDDTIDNIGESRDAIEAEGFEYSGASVGSQGIDNLRYATDTQIPLSIASSLELKYNAAGRNSILYMGGATAVKHGHDFYKKTKFRYKKPLADFVYREVFSGDDGIGLGGDGPVVNFGQVRALSTFAPTGQYSEGGATRQKPFTDLLKSMTFVATGLPEFDALGFLDIKIGDFTHLEMDRLSGKINEALGGDNQYTPYSDTNFNRLVALYEHAFGPPGGDEAHGHNVSPTQYMYQNIPTHRSHEAFMRGYYEGTMGSGTRDPSYFGDDDPDADASAPDHSIHFRFDPSCVPYTAFRIHFDNTEYGVLNKNYVVLDDGSGIHVTALHPYVSTTWASSAKRILGGPHSLDSYDGANDYAYNLESALCGRLPAVFIDGATASSYNTSYGASYGPGLSPAHILDGYTTEQKNIMIGNLLYKSRNPFPMDGTLNTFTYGGPGTGHAVQYYNYFTGHYASYQATIDDYAASGKFAMAWYYRPATAWGVASVGATARNRYRTSLRKFFGTRGYNALNCLSTMRKNVEKLASGWTYDAEPKETRIRMQKRTQILETEFSAIGEGVNETEAIGTMVELDPDATVSTSDVLPDDAPGTDDGSY